ncbi:hypothetical protein [Shewanella baltica]|uniref:hypothetical protein n=1 Tax=Shewanella baltica TaxID=62322 RepID=UPI00217E21B7|nr:hypothetical protein [Shewanella baltica]MCS6098743.1 hypothetical protein [Shewanella baltica]MCS6185420.1 hypothetical protein [Shewanella baltica]
MSITTSLGQQFRKARAQHGCSAGTIGNLINVTQSEWLAFELGMKTRQPLTMIQLKKAADFIKLQIKPTTIANALRGQSCN